MSSSLLAGFMLLVSCSTRTATTNYPAGSPASPDTPTAPPQTPNSLSDELLLVSYERAAPAMEATHQHEHAGHQHASAHESAPQAPAQQDQSNAAKYACPMHPAEVASEPGRCSICGMNLEPVK